MTSGTGRNPGEQGFTLLEMITTLAVMGLFTGLIVFNFSGEDREGRLTKVGTALQKAALLAKYQAHSTGKDHYLLLDSDGFVVTGALPRGKGTLLAGTASPDTILSEERFPEELEVRIRRHETDPWKIPGEEPWIFRSSGLNDPMEIRFSIGNDFAFLQFEVLTGRAERYVMIE